MTQAASMPDLDVSFVNHVAIVEIRRPPHNFFDLALIEGIANAYEALDKDPNCRAIVLCAQGTAFCAGADFSKRDDDAQTRRPGVLNPLYTEAIRMFACAKPVVAAVQGAAVGGGLGLAISADFRVACPESKFSANFNRLGFHPGFGLSATLPRLIGQQKTELMFLTGRRIAGAGIGLRMKGAGGVTAALDWAVALKDLGAVQRGDKRLYFKLGYDW